MSDFDYYYTFYDKSRGDRVLTALRQSSAETKSEAIDFLIDRGYLHSDEVYDSAVANALGDFVGISVYDSDDEEEFEAPVGTKHSALDEVHQRLRESGKKRRQQKITKARRMKQRKFEGHHGHHHAAEMTLDDLAWITRQNRKIEQAAKNPRKNERIIGNYVEELNEYIDSRMKEAEMEMTPDIMEYPGLPVVPDSYGTNSALDSGNGVPQWYGFAESANPTGGATGDQIVSWEHNGLSSPSGPPSDIFWSESTEGIQINFSGAEVMRITKHFGITKDQLQRIMKSAIKEQLETVQQDYYTSVFYTGYYANPNAYDDDTNIELYAEGYGDISRYITIDFTWDYSGEHEDLVSDGEYYITEQIKDLVESEVNSGEYGGNGSYTYTVENETATPEILEIIDVEIDYSWG